MAYEKLNINEENVNLLQRQFELDNARLSRGQITASDLAQSQSSLAGAQARYIEAQNNIVTSKLNYENVIGAIAAKENLKKKTHLNKKALCFLCFCLFLLLVCLLFLP